jgi:hypothetical protein
MPNSGHGGGLVGKGVSRLPEQSTCRTGEYRGKRPPPAPLAWAHPAWQPSIDRWIIRDLLFTPATVSRASASLSRQAHGFLQPPRPPVEGRPATASKQCRNTVERFFDTVYFHNFLKNKSLPTETGAVSNRRRGPRFSGGQDRQGTWLSDNGPPSTVRHCTVSEKEVSCSLWVTSADSVGKTFDGVSTLFDAVGTLRAGKVDRPVVTSPQAAPASDLPDAKGGHDLIRAGARWIAWRPSRPASYGGAPPVCPVRRCPC